MLHPLYDLGERTYDPSWFDGSVERFCVDDHNAPKLRYDSRFALGIVIVSTLSPLVMSRSSVDVEAVTDQCPPPCGRYLLPNQRDSRLLCQCKGLSRARQRQCYSCAL